MTDDKSRQLLFGRGKIAIFSDSRDAVAGAICPVESLSVPVEEESPRDRIAVSEATATLTNVSFSQPALTYLETVSVCDTVIEIARRLDMNPLEVLQHYELAGVSPEIVVGVRDMLYQLRD